VRVITVDEHGKGLKGGSPVARLRLGWGVSTSPADTRGRVSVLYGIEQSGKKAAWVRFHQEPEGHLSAFVGSILITLPVLRDRRFPRHSEVEGR
jgi:hypothetical protein